MSKTKATKKYKVIDLFAGTGAFSLAFKNNKKFEVVYANDMEPNSQEIYSLNHPDHTFFLGDINEIDVEDIPTHNILCSGFSCQPFSIAGKQKGFDDERSNVFWKILKILDHHKPEIIILENVKNLKSHDKGNTFKVIEENLTKLGYHLKYQILDTCKMTDIPQHRERIYILGFLDEKLASTFNFDFPKIKNKKIEECLEEKVPSKYYYTSKLKVYEEIKNNMTKDIHQNVLYQYRRYYLRENKNGCCPTLTANMGSGGHNVPLLLDDNGIRKLTPRECFNLQGFPQEYSFPKISDSSLYKLAGNAVSVPVVKKIVDKLSDILP